MASDLIWLTDTSFPLWEHYAYLSFSYRQSPFSSEVIPQMNGSEGRISVTLYNQMNITSFTTTTILLSNAAVNASLLNLVTTTVSPKTVIIITTIISSLRPPQASVVMSKVEKPDLPSNTAYPPGDDH